MSRVLGRPPLGVAFKAYTAGRDLQLLLHRRRLALRVMFRMWREGVKGELPVVRGMDQVEDEECTEAGGVGHTDDAGGGTGGAGGEQLMRGRAGDAGKGVERGDAAAAP